MELLNLNMNEDYSHWGIERTSAVKNLVLGEETKQYDVMKIPVDSLAYNLNNGRMFMEVKKFESEEEVCLEDLKNQDFQRYNDEIENLIWSTNEERNKNTKLDIFKYGQLEPGVVLDDGTVIDGNRRFTCIRKLHREYPEDERFKYFEAAIVMVDGKDVTKELLKKYELKVQFGTDEKLSYNTINMNMSIYELVKSETFDYTTIADLIGKKANDVMKIVNTCKLVDEFLEYINKPKEYIFAEKYNVYWPLEPLADYIKKNGKNMSGFEIQQKKEIFFDYLLTLDVELMTQNLRDGLIKKIYNNPEESEKLIEKHNEIIGNKIRETIEQQSSEEQFEENIEKLRKSEEAKKDETLYRDAVNKLTSKNQIDIPYKECKKALECLENVNVQPLLKSNNDISLQKLLEIKEKLEEVIKTANEIVLEIDSND